MPNVRKPTSLRVLDGETVTPPPVRPARPPSPDWSDIADERIAKRAAKEFDRLVELIDQTGALSSWDLQTVHAAAVSYAGWQVAMLDDDGVGARQWMRLNIQYAGKLGLSPSDRQKMVWPVSMAETAHVLDGPHNMPSWGLTTSY